jgi:hypothetical protein
MMFLIRWYGIRGGGRKAASSCSGVPDIVVVVLDDGGASRGAEGEGGGWERRRVAEGGTASASIMWVAARSSSRHIKAEDMAWGKPCLATMSAATAVMAFVITDHDFRFLSFVTITVREKSKKMASRLLLLLLFAAFAQAMDVSVRENQLQSIPLRPAADLTSLR